MLYAKGFPIQVKVGASLSTFKVPAQEAASLGRRGSKCISVYTAAVPEGLCWARHFAKLITNVITVNCHNIPMKAETIIVHIL